MKVGTVDNVTTKSGEMRKRRNLLICDETNTSICLCIWGEKAFIKFDENPVIAVKGAKVSEFFKRSINAYDDTKIYLNCTFERSKDMKLWYECLMDEAGEGASQPNVQFRLLSEGFLEVLNGVKSPNSSLKAKPTQAPKKKPPVLNPEEEFDDPKTKGSQIDFEQADEDA